MFLLFRPSLGGAPGVALQALRLPLPGEGLLGLGGGSGSPGRLCRLTLETLGIGGNSVGPLPRRCGGKGQTVPGCQHPLVHLGVRGLRPEHHPGGLIALLRPPLPDPHPKRGLEQHRKTAFIPIHIQFPPISKDMENGRPGREGY